MKLNPRQVDTAKPKEKNYKLSDGGGMYLEVTPRGAKYWRMKYYRPGDKKEDKLAFGVYPAVSLAEARAKRDEAKKLLAKRIDPKKVQQEEMAEAKGEFTFEHIARKWHANNKRWGGYTRASTLRSLEIHVFPVIGKADIRQLKTRHLLAVVRAVEECGKHDIAQRLQQRITKVMRYAVQHEIIESNPALDMAGALIPPHATHRAALPPERIPELLSRIANYKGRKLTRLALELNLLTFVRSSELRFARWSEIDVDRALWEIPAKREPLAGVIYSERGMKMKSPHIVPLSRQALDVLRQLEALRGEEGHIFPSDRDPYKTMNERTINKALKVMGYDTKTEVCGHGFRTMARGAIGESGLWADDVIELQMSHIERNGVKAAYLHTTKHLEERRLMMQWWADYLDANRESYISPYDFARCNKQG
ncbi:tyrosine-type recombinase/integrase [Sodalis praecaptivus]|uniref:tyrosine-type recombinase/integrase n=1 Tax=Sodalis praecaptivus TaxID=1239307 RepID=UPI0027FDCE0E|nr:integrase arm-type DNA-binding domain-containing protein [Sodalis praecaptivus]CAJ0995419.1 Prophage integrase IntA [Sodalis praecaptivus]